MRRGSIIGKDPKGEKRRKETRDKGVSHPPLLQGTARAKRERAKEKAKKAKKRGKDLIERRQERGKEP